MEYGKAVSFIAQPLEQGRHREVGEKHRVFAAR